MNTTYRSCVEKLDFEKRKPNALTFTTDDVTPSLNEISYHSDNSLHVNKGAGTSGYFKLNVGYLFVGDTLEISGEFMSITGALPQMIVDVTDKNGVTTNGITQIGPLYSGQFEAVNLSLPIAKEGTYSIVYGVPTAEAGTYKMRNLTAKANTVKQQDSNVRKGLFTNATGGWIVDKSRAFDPCTIEVDDTTTLLITFDEPLKSPNNLKGIATVTTDFSSASKYYLVKGGATTQNSVKIQIYDLRNDPTVAVPIADVQAGLFFSLTLEV